ncbi:MAG TPA: spermidine/putrescine ABC transporter substrate-binding protein [Opitutaceae bacterium]|nr:spermidine/putrescine ABC transporter substrate-binding protein [Opitutaceae bacterium]
MLKPTTRLLASFASLASLAAIASLTVFSSVAHAADDNELNLFAWSEYVPQDVIDGFTKETGIKVNYETFASGEEMLAKLLAGNTAYDIVQPPDYVAESLIQAKQLRELDPKQLPHMSNILPEFLHMPHDPTQRYTVPYMTGTVGIVVNTEKVKEPIRGFKDVFQPKYAGRIVVVNDNREMLTWAMYTLGLKANDLTRENIDKARPVLAQWIKLIKVFDSDSPKTSLLNGDTDLGVVWSGEAALLYRENPKFHYVIPAEGAHQFVDVVAIPLHAPHVEAAHRFIDYLLRPEVSKRISDAFPYTNPNGAARKLLSKEQLENPASYPPVGKLETFRAIGKTSQVIDELVTDLKNSR